VARSAIKFLDLEPRDGSLYVHGFHSSLALKGSRVVATSEEVRHEIPVERLGRVFVFGRCSFGSGLLDALLGMNVPTFHLSVGGSPRGVTMTMRNLRRSLPSRSSIAEVMGVEGAAARSYF
jgi:CRISPR/Cas system-associated endonuclease Cas1